MAFGNKKESPLVEEAQALGATNPVDDLPFDEQDPEEALATATAAGAVETVMIGDEIITLDQVEDQAMMPVQIDVDRLVGQPFAVEAVWVQAKVSSDIHIYDMVLVSGRLVEVGDDGKLSRVGGRPFIFITGRINQANGDPSQVLASQFEPLLTPVDPKTGEKLLPLIVTRGLTAHPTDDSPYYTMTRTREESGDVDLWGDGE